MDIGLVAGAIAAGLTAALAVVHVVRRRRREARDRAALARNVERGLNLPPTLHPVIDPDVCIGSLACLRACPEGDILGIVQGAAALVHATQCIGHGQCAVQCPVGAIRLVFGTAERGVDLPEVDEHFESSRAGVHVVGELGGMGLIRNAVEQGVQCGDRLAHVLKAAGAAPIGTTDVAIVGAGPAGLGAALRLQQAGRSFRLLEQGAFGGTVANYPRQKLVMTEPLQLPSGHRLRSRLVSKEELLAFFCEARDGAGLTVEEGVKVTGLEGQDGAFRLQTTAGEVWARKVVLATGRRGSPRKPGVPGEELDNVSYSLTDPEQYQGSSVLVVGGGDAAVEAACTLAAEPAVQATLSYRGAELSRCREPNRRRAEELAAQGRLRLLLSSEVREIAPSEVRLTASGEPLTIANDYVICCLGGELPVEFLRSVSVQMRRHFGEARGATEENTRRLRATLAKERAERSASRRRAALYLMVGLVIVAALAWVGRDYYPLGRALRLRSPLHASLKPAGPWGHGVGIAATLVMLSNFLYAARKRTRALQRAGSLRSWLDFHVFVGFMSPAVIVFHTAFQSNNQLATGTAASLAVVVATGIVGRYLYGLVPAEGGKTLELAEVLARFERLRARLKPLIEDTDDPAEVERVLAAASAQPSSAPLLAQLFALPFASLSLRARLLRAGRHFPDAQERAEFEDAVLRLSRLRAQIGLFRGLKALMRGWRALHASLAALLVIAIAAHVGVSLYLGYGLLR